MLLTQITITLFLKINLFIWEEEKVCMWVEEMAERSRLPWSMEPWEWSHKTQNMTWAKTKNWTFNPLSHSGALISFYFNYIVFWGFCLHFLNLAQVCVTALIQKNNYFLGCAALCNIKETKIRYSLEEEINFWFVLNIHTQYWVQ